MTTLQERIESAIEEKAMRTGATGTESVNVEMALTQEEREEFLSTDKYDNKHYSWEFDNNILYISYTEEF